MTRLHVRPSRPYTPSKQLSFPFTMPRWTHSHHGGQLASTRGPFTPPGSALRQYLLRFCSGPMTDGGRETKAKICFPPQPEAEMTTEKRVGGVDSLMLCRSSDIDSRSMIRNADQRRVGGGGGAGKAQGGGRRADPHGYVHFSFPTVTGPSSPDCLNLSSFRWHTPLSSTFRIYTTTSRDRHRCQGWRHRAVARLRWAGCGYGSKREGDLSVQRSGDPWNHRVDLKKRCWTFCVPFPAIV